MKIAASKRRVVEHEFYARLRDGQLKQSTIRQYLIGGWPVVEQFSLYMAHNPTKTRYGRHQGEDMARRWLMRNIRVELNHADYWVNWCQAHGVHLHDLQAQDVPPELNGLNDWCWRVCATENLAIAMAATNYAIEGATGEWSAVVCSTDTYAMGFPEEGRKRAMKWLKMHAQYDDAHPWEALEIICTPGRREPQPGLAHRVAQGDLQELRLHVPVPGAVHAAGGRQQRRARRWPPGRPAPLRSKAAMGRAAAGNLGRYWAFSACPFTAFAVRPHQVQVHGHDFFRQRVVLRVLARVSLRPHRCARGPGLMLLAAPAPRLPVRRPGSASGPRWRTDTP